MTLQPDPQLARTVREKLASHPSRHPLAPPISPDPELTPKDRDLAEVVSQLGAEVYHDRALREARRLIHQPGVRSLERLARRLWQFRGRHRKHGVLALGIGPSADGQSAIKLFVNSARTAHHFRDCNRVTSPAGFTHRVEVAVVPKFAAHCAGVPVQGGCSIGHTPLGASPVWGTIACRVGRTDGYHYLLSAGHVFDGSNRPAAGGSLSHPCPPVAAATPIAALFAIRLTDRQPLDAALIGPVSAATAAPNIPGIPCNLAGFRAPRQNEEVRMYGAANGGRVVTGTVYDIYAFALVTFPGVGRRYLVDLVSVRMNNSPVADAGDSGGAWVGSDDMLLGVHTGVSTAGLALFTKFSHAATDPLLGGIIPA